MKEEMNQSVLVLLHSRSKYVAGVFTPNGLYATSLPRDSEEYAIEAVDGFNLPESNDIQYKKILEIVFDLIEGIKRPEANQIELDFSNLTEKQIAVLKAVRMIPRGKTLTYGTVAKYVGLPEAARFVGNVMASNRFAPFVPCHRVVSTTGLGGYNGGLEIKRGILTKEGAFAD